MIQIIVQNQYMTEKVRPSFSLALVSTLTVSNLVFQVERSAFASDKSIKQMMGTMEEFYAASFGM